MRLTADHIIRHLQAQGQWVPDRARIEAALAAVDQDAVEQEEGRRIRVHIWDRQTPVRTGRFPKGLAPEQLLRKKDVPAGGALYLLEEEIEIEARLQTGLTGTAWRELPHEEIVSGSDRLEPLADILTADEEAGLSPIPPFDPAADYEFDAAAGQIRRRGGGRVPGGQPLRLVYRVWLATQFQPHAPWVGGGVGGIRPMRPEHVDHWAELQRWQQIEDRAEARVLERVLQAVGINQETLNVQRGGGGNSLLVVLLEPASRNRPRWQPGPRRSPLASRLGRG